MSGVFGIVRFDDQSVSQQDLDRQIRRIAHLGPDGVRSWREGPAGIGAMLMRVSHEDLLDRQPVRDPVSGLVLVSDARLDNREELAAALAIDAEHLLDMPDSALLLAAYKAWGPACAERLIGDFVFAVWNARTRALDLVRDHMGQRQVFFHKGENFFAFATEVTGLRALADVPRILPDALVARLLLRDGPRGRRELEMSPPNGIGFLPGGSILSVAADGAITSRRYWEPHAAPEHQNRDEAYYIDAYRRILGEAVACRLRRTTAPVGLFLSGGIDSAAIAGLAGPLVAAQGRKLVAVSSVMPEDYRGEGLNARKWVEMCRRDMPHLDVRFVTGEGLDIFTGMEKAFLYSDSGHSDHSYMLDAMSATFRSAGARTVMDGYGGDYSINPQGQTVLLWLLKTGRWRQFISEWRARRLFLNVSHARLFKDAILRHLAPPLWRAWVSYRVGLYPFEPGAPVTKLFMREAAEMGVAPKKRQSRSPRAHLKHILDSIQSAPVIGSSISSAAHGLKFTQPFHDKRVVELGLAVPEDLYMKNGRERHLSRTAFADILPIELQTRRPGNDSLAPGLMTMAERVRPRILAEIDRMEESGKLGRYFDFPRMRKMLNGRPGERMKPAPTRKVMQAYIRARYIEWFRGYNR